MTNQACDHPPTVRTVTFTRRGQGGTFEGVVHLGPGRAVLEAVARTTGRSALTVLGLVVKELLVKKGADWNSAILSEYLGLFEDSAGTYCLISDSRSGQLVAHAAVFQSVHHPVAGLLAHVRTAEGWGGYGLGTRVTEEVTRSAFAQGARVVVLETDDLLFRKRQGERAAVGLYGRLGYSVLAEKAKGEAMGWLMAIDAEVFAQCQALPASQAGVLPPDIRLMQEALIANTRARYTASAGGLEVDRVKAGDLAGLFLLLNLCPPDDFRLKLAAWGVVEGPEFERAFVVTVRPAMADGDRLEDVSMVLRDPVAGIVAVCAARQAQPFSRGAFSLDFYCLPAFLGGHRGAVRALVEATIGRIRDASDRPPGCQLLHAGCDPVKRELFAELGFVMKAPGPARRLAEETANPAVIEYERFLQ